MNTPDEKNEDKSDTSTNPVGNDIKRNELGQPLPGQVLNPNGNNGLMKGYQPYASRLQRYNQMPMDELETLIASTDFKKYSAIERAAVFHAKRIGDEKDDNHIPERERGNERIEGKSKQPLAIGGDANNTTPISLDGSFTLTFGTEDNDGTKTSGA